jgi:hypothetical protein
MKKARQSELGSASQHVAYLVGAGLLSPGWLVLDLERRESQHAQILRFRPLSLANC